MAATATPVSFASIDDCLGPAERRFFGDGYKRVDQWLGALEVVTADDGSATVTGRADLSYPADWSVKSTGTDLRPHLSTVDALVLGARLAEICLTHAHRLDPDQRRRSWLSRFAMRAGSTPQENLADLAVRAWRTGPAQPAGMPGTAVSVIRCRLGSVRVSCEVTHPDVPAVPPGRAGYATEELLLGPADRRYFGRAYRLRGHAVRRVRVQPDRGRVEATATVRPYDTGVAGDGLGAFHQPSLTMIDCMTLSAQLAQILLYQQDGLRRGHTNTLWMRKVVMACRSPVQPLAEPVPLVVTGGDSHLVTLAGRQWRISDVEGGFPGIDGRASLAHQLPPSAPSPSDKEH